MKRLIIGPCRSGTTMVLRAFRNNPHVLINDFQSIKNGQRKDGYPDYSFFDQTAPQEKVLIGKETIGYGTLVDCRLEIFPRSRFAELIIETIPLFCFRNPFRTFNSWRRNNLVFPTIGPKFFIEAYKWSYDMYLRAHKKNHNVALCVYEQFCEMPEYTLRAICTRWDIPYDQRMLSWDDDVATMHLDHDGVTDGHYHRVIVSRTIEREIPEEMDMPIAYLKVLRASGLEKLYATIMEANL